MRTSLACPVLLAVLLLDACGDAPSSGVAKDGASESASAKAGFRWPPRFGKNDSVAASLPSDARLMGGISRDDPLLAEGTQRLGADGQFWPEEGSYRITGGSFFTRVGEIERRVRFTDWVSVYKDATRAQKAGFAYCATDGQLILPKEVLVKPPKDLYVDTAFEAEDFGERFVLVTLDSKRKHRACFMPRGGGYLPTVGLIGSTAFVRGVPIERKEGGWYRGTTLVSEPE